VIIKTFVTTDLLKAIAEHYGLRCVETLTVSNISLPSWQI